MPETPDELEDKLDYRYQLGISVGYKQAAAYILQKAPESFEQMHDNNALTLRELAGYMRRRSKEYHPKKEVK